jgi:hypothetical protein
MTGAARRCPVQDVPRLPQPSRTLVVPLLAAALGAGVATATFAVVNIEDQPSVSLPAVVQSAPPSAALAGQRTDGGPEEGTAAQAMQPPYTASPDYRSSYQPASALSGSKAGASSEGPSADVVVSTQPPKGVFVSPSSEPRYDGGPNEGSSASAIAQP